jgi:hypothetical protein
MEKAKCDHRCLPVIIKLCDSMEHQQALIEEQRQTATVSQEVVHSDAIDHDQLDIYEKLFQSYREACHHSYIEEERDLVRIIIYRDQ